MPLDAKQKRIIAGVCTAGAIIGGVAIYMSSRAKEKEDQEEEEAFGTPLQPEKLKESNTHSPHTNNIKNDNINNNNNNKVINSSTKQSTGTTFNEFFCTVYPPRGWEVSSTPAPMPTMALISFKNPALFDYDNEEAMSTQPGAVPGIMLTIEDISNEGLTEKEIHDKNKTMAFQQMEMMTQGRVSSVVQTEGPAKNMGVFNHYLEYTQSMPPYINMQICNATCVKNGLAYVFQYMAVPHVFAAHKDIVFEMARTIIIHNDVSPASIDYRLGAYVSVSIPEHDISVSTLPAWTVKSGAGGDNGSIAEITTGSFTKKEMFSIYRNSEIAKAALASGGFEVVNEKSNSGDNNNNNIIIYKNSGKKESKLFTLESSSYALVATPLQISTIVTPDCHIQTALKSVNSDINNNNNNNNTSTKTISRTFINQKDNYEFPLSKDGAIIQSKISCGTCIYAPIGVEAMQSGAEGPTVTFRVGTPETDPSCVSTISEWKEKLINENDKISSSDLKPVVFGGESGITFTTKEMEEVGGGRKSETTSKVVIVVRNGVTTLMRWEVPSDVWRTSERHLGEVMREFRFL